MRTRLLAAVPGGHAIDVQHRDHEHVRVIPQPSRLGLVTEQPFDEAPCHPRRAAFPGVLPSLDPDGRKSSLMVRRYPQPAHGPALERPSQFESDCLAWQGGDGPLEEFVALPRREGRAPRDPQRATRPGEPIRHVIGLALAGIRLSPGHTIRGKRGPIRQRPGGCKWLPGVPPVVPRRPFAATHDHADFPPGGEPVDPEIPPTGPAALGISTGPDPNLAAHGVDRIDDGRPTLEVRRHHEVCPKPTRPSEQEHHSG